MKEQPSELQYILDRYVRPDTDLLCQKIWNCNKKELAKVAGEILATKLIEEVLLSDSQ